MNTKAFTSTLLVCTLSLLAFTACSNHTEYSDDTEHTHTPSSAWKCNAAEHWQACECGENINLAAHAINSDNLCEICSSEILDLGDGLFDVYTYNEHGDIIRYISYNADKSIAYESSYEIEYDTNGNRVSEKYYDNGTLNSETLYAIGEDGSAYEAKITGYQSDGSYFVNKYNENSDITLVVFYDADGNKLTENIYEYATDADGNTYESKCSEYYYDLDKIYISEHNEYGDQTSRTVCDIEGNVQLTDRFEYEYNDEGDPIWKKHYTNDVLVQEITGYKTYISDDYSMRFPERVIDYYEDGTKLITANGDNGDVSSETYYTADGTVDRSVTYVYETDENGNRTRVKAFENCVLFSDTEYSYDEEYGYSYPSKVTEYDKDGNIVKETSYDSDGNEIE